MAFDFPASPAIGDEYSSGGSTYTWNGYAWIKTGGGAGPGPPAEYVLKTGDVMTGFLTLSADPVQPLHAATKQYTDSVALPLGGAAGEALVKSVANVATWGAPISGGNF